MKSIRMLIFSAAFALTACSDHITTSTEMVFDNEPPPVEEVVTFSFVQENVLDVSCALSGCHAGGAFPDLSAGSSYGNIVDVLGSQGLDLVEPGDPENSYLFIKITGGGRDERSAHALRRCPFARRQHRCGPKMDRGRRTRRLTEADGISNRQSRCRSFSAFGPII